MSENKELFEKVKVNIASVLTGNARPLSSTQVNSDYMLITGVPIPYYRLGYSSIENLLLDLRDEVHVVQTNRGYLFKAVVKENNAHMANFVQRQKPSKPTANASRYNLPPRMGGPGGPRSAYKVDNRPVSMPGSCTSGQIPSFVQSQMVQLLRKYPSGIPFKNFGAMFESEYKYHISPTSFSFGTWFDMFKSMSQTINIKNTGTEFVVYLQEHLLNDERQANDRPKSRSNCQSPRKMNRNSYEVSPPASSQHSAGSPEPMTYGQEESSAHVNDKMKATFREILSMHKEGLWCSYLPEKYEELTKHSLDTRDLGFYSVIEMVTALSDIFTAQKTLNTSDWLLFDARVVKPEPKNVAACGGKYGTDLHPVPLMYQRRILQVISSYQKGMFTSDFDAIYTKYFGEGLKPEKFGFYSTELLLKSLTHSLEMTPLDNERIIVRVLPSVRDLCDITTLKNIEDLQTRETPQDAIKDPFKIPQQEIDGNLSSDVYHGVYVTSVTNPADFWVQLRGETTSIALDTLMDNLEEFYYGALGEFYYIPFAKIFVQMVCVATYPEDNNWHRCTVHTIKSKDEVELFYIDYGSYATVNSNVLRYMMKDFAKLPAQGIPAYLANILPANGQTWSLACRNRFSALVNDKPLVAIIATDEITYPLAICLCDTTGVADVHVNDTLVREGLAEQCTPSIMVENTETLPDPEINGESSSGPNAFLMDYCRHMLQVGEKTRDSNSSMWSLNRNAVCDIINTANHDFKSGNSKNSRPVYIRKVNASEQNTVHIINVDGKSYSTTADLSSILFPDCDRDILAFQLGLHKLQVPMIEVSKWSHGRLLEQLSKIKTLDGRFHYKGTSRHLISLCPVESLSMMLDTFADIDSKQIQTVLNTASDFNPNNTAWCKV